MQKGPSSSREKRSKLESDGTFRAIFESAVEGIIAVNRDGKILLANSQSLELFGYSEGDLIGRSVELLVPKSVRSMHKNLREKFHQDPVPRRMGHGRDLVGVRSDGSKFPIEVSLSPVAVQGEPLVIAFIIDITERKRIEEQVRREKEAAQSYLDIAGVMLLILKPDGKVGMINKMGCKMLDYPEEEIVGKDWFENFVPPEQREDVRGIFKANISKGAKFYAQYENQIICRNGTVKDIYWNNTGLEDNKGNIMGSLSSGTDITERRQVEEALMKSEKQLIVYASQLEKKVQERTDELARAIEDLRNSNKDLEKEIEMRMKVEKEVQKALEKERQLNELKSRFVSTASHEFRTPLSTILSSASLIQKYKGEEAQDQRQKHIHRIKTAVSNLTAILNDFLSLDKLETGKIQVSIAQCDPLVLVEEVKDELQPIRKEGQTINIFSRREHPPLISTDIKLLKGILTNLLSNAIKYSGPAKPINVDINAGERWITIRVIDQGIGIPASDQSHMFERFFRAPNANNIQGTGLGLNIAKRYLEVLGGEIDFTSALNQGSTFSIKLPLNYTDHEKNIGDRG